MPSVPSLLNALKHTHAVAFRHAQGKLMATPGMGECLQWQGVWRWTLVYSHPNLPQHAWVFLVPDPTRPLISVPVPETVLPALSSRRMTRTVKEALVQAPVVGGVRWATWELTSKSLVDEVLAIAAAKAGKCVPETAMNRTPAGARRAS